MKFEVGDNVVCKQTKEEGIVVAVIGPPFDFDYAVRFNNSGDLGMSECELEKVPSA